MLDTINRRWERGANHRAREKTEEFHKSKRFSLWRVHVCVRVVVVSMFSAVVLVARIACVSMHVGAARCAGILAIPTLAYATAYAPLTPAYAKHSITQATVNL